MPEQHSVGVGAPVDGQRVHQRAREVAARRGGDHQVVADQRRGQAEPGVGVRDRHREPPLVLGAAGLEGEEQQVAAEGGGDGLVADDHDGRGRPGEPAGPQPVAGAGVVGHEPRVGREREQDAVARGHRHLGRCAVGRRPALPAVLVEGVQHGVLVGHDDQLVGAGARATTGPCARPSASERDQRLSPSSTSSDWTVPDVSATTSASPVSTGGVRAGPSSSTSHTGSPSVRSSIVTEPSSLGTATPASVSVGDAETTSSSSWTHSARPSAIESAHTRRSPSPTTTRSPTTSGDATTGAPTWTCQRTAPLRSRTETHPVFSPRTRSVARGDRGGGGAVGARVGPGQLGHQLAVGHGEAPPRVEPLGAAGRAPRPPRPSGRLVPLGVPAAGPAVELGQLLGEREVEGLDGVDAAHHAVAGAGPLLERLLDLGLALLEREADVVDPVRAALEGATADLDVLERHHLGLVGVGDLAEQPVVLQLLALVRSQLVRRRRGGEHVEAAVLRRGVLLEVVAVDAEPGDGRRARRCRGSRCSCASSWPCRPRRSSSSS